MGSRGSMEISDLSSSFRIPLGAGALGSPRIYAHRIGGLCSRKAVKLLIVTC
jgi:hypothetical protein